MELRTKKGHSSGELGMSSMTDIIFILLMFFMMTSTLTAPSALNLTLPGKSKTASKIPHDRMNDISIKGNGSYLLNGRPADIATIQRILEKEVQISSKKINITISPSPEAPVESVVAVMDITTKLGINAILSTEDN